MVVVLASRFDAGAAALVRRWRRHDARLLTCEGLSRRGWVWESHAVSRARLTLDDEVLPMESVRGVVSLLFGVDPSELPHIAAEERAYVAAEMSAFLVAWLSHVRCRVVNRPSPLCLSGPRLYHEQWLLEAMRAGLPIEPARRHVAPYSTATITTEQVGHVAQRPATDEDIGVSVAVVAGRCVPPPDRPVPREILTGLSRLADTVRAGLLTVRLMGVGAHLRFAGATPLVDVSQASVADALLDAFGVSA